MSAPLLSVIVPVYNEAGAVRASVERLRAVPLRMEVICVDDASTDGSADVLAALLRDGRVDAVVTHARNLGKGAAVRSGIARVSGEVLVIHDADLEYDPADLPRLLEPIAAGRADAVFGSRFLGGTHRVLRFWQRVGNEVLTRLSNAATGLHLTDMETCYKMARTDLVRSLPLSATRFGIEVELTARLAQSGARIHEIPIHYDGRGYSEGKKIGWKDGVAAIFHVLHYNLLGPRPPRYTRTAMPREGGGALTRPPDSGHPLPKLPGRGY